MEGGQLLWLCPLPLRFPPASVPLLLLLFLGVCLGSDGSSRGAACSTSSCRSSIGGDEAEVEGHCPFYSLLAL